MRFSIRQRLLTVALISAITCAASLCALLLLLRSSSDQRQDRARDAVTSELVLLATGNGAPTMPSFLGMRGGVAHPPLVAAATLEPAIGAALEEASRESLRTGGNSIKMIEVGEGATFVGVGPAPSTDQAWSVYALRPARNAGTWRLIVYSLAAATFLLVATAVSAVRTVQQGASALRTSLTALASDLSAPIPRPPVRELSDVADGIANLAEALARVQGEKERLGQKLAERERLASLGRVVAGVAHEVRNPLASIKLRLDLAGSDAELAPRLASELSGLSAEIDRLDRLVADLLVVAGRRRSGPRASASLGPLVRSRVQLLCPWAEARGVEIHVSGGDASSWLDADSVSRAIDNLVRNAVEASPSGTAVEVEVASDPEVARVRVLDHGEGVDTERQRELFEPFFTTKADGTGLGLALSRAIASAHEGALTYDRHDGITCFELTLPRRAAGDAEVRA